MIKEIQIALKMQKCHDTVKKLYGSEFETSISEYTRLIKAATAKHNLTSHLEGAMKLIEDSKDMDGGDIFAMKILAACYELAENTKNKDKDENKRD